MAERADGVVEVVVSWGDEVLDVRHVRPHAIDAVLVPVGNETVRIERDGLTLVARRTDAVPAPPRTAHRAPAELAAWWGVSVAVHAVIVAIFWLTPPRALPANQSRIVTSGPLAGTDLSEEALQTRLAGVGGRHAEREGRLGSTEERRTRGRFAVPRREERTAPRLARDRGHGSMEAIGAIGAVRAMMGSWSTPISPYGAAQAQGGDPTAALGAMMGDRLADAPGMDGLGMRGTGRGGGGTGAGTIGLGVLGTVGHGRGGVPEGQGSGYGRGAGGLRARESRGPIVHCPSGVDPDGHRVGCMGTIVGGLSPEVIRRVVRRRLAEVRFCYEQGLVQNPSLEGRVTVQWIIASDGHVASASLSSSDVSSASVEQCIVSAVRRWSFPADPSGNATGVTYPFVLQPS